jgi:hypothetical protein|tara:strand:- start:68 stop:283 length:216 start_codon:yes stop_codon:yes gene_type:complete
MTETILHHASSVAALLERLPPEPHLRGKEFERAAKWFLKTDPAYASELLVFSGDQVEGPVWTLQWTFNDQA